MIIIERRLFIVFFSILCAEASFSCKSVQKSTHKQETEVQVNSVDSSHAAVKSIVDTSSKELHVKKNNFDLVIEDPVFDTVKRPSSGNAVQDLFDRLLGAGKIGLTGHSTDSLLKENAGKATYDSTHNQISVRDSSFSNKEEDFFKVAKAKSYWWLWLFPIAILLLWWKRNWIIEKITA